MALDEDDVVEVEEEATRRGNLAPVKRAKFDGEIGAVKLTPCGIPLPEWVNNCNEQHFISYKLQQFSKVKQICQSYKLLLYSFSNSKG